MRFIELVREDRSKETIHLDSIRKIIKTGDGYIRIYGGPGMGSDKYLHDYDYIANYLKRKLEL